MDMILLMLKLTMGRGINIKNKLIYLLIVVSTVVGLVGCGTANSTPGMLPGETDEHLFVLLPTLEPIETLVPTATPRANAVAATPEPTPAWSYYKSRVNLLNVRQQSNTESKVIAKLGFEDCVRVVGEEGEFYRIWFGGSKYGYCYSSYMVPAEETLYGYHAPQSEFKTDSEGNIIYEDDGVTPVMLESELIDIRLYIPNIEVYQIFGTPSNFTGIPLYDRPVPVLQRRTAIKLAKAAELFARDGYTIKIYDCYRPKSVQYILYDIVQNSSYIANPYNSASNHNRAAAVDMTLIGPDGVELEFPTEMHYFGKEANRGCDTWTEEQFENVAYMTAVMVKCGFRTIDSEWWHFSDTDYMDFMVLDMTMSSIPMFTAEQLGFDD